MCHDCMWPACTREDPPNHISPKHQHWQPAPLPCMLADIYIDIDKVCVGKYLCPAAICRKYAGVTCGHQVRGAPG